jgi:hypothetical protein
VGTEIEVVLSILCCRKGSYRSGHTTDWGTDFEVLFFWVGRTTVRTWHDFRGIFLEGLFGCCKWFSLGFKCNLAANITFLKLIKKLSLGFPTLGFSLAGCLNFSVLHGCVIVVHCVYSASKVLGNVYFCS